jgi:acetyl esterase/lipase
MSTTRRLSLLVAGLLLATPALTADEAKAPAKVRAKFDVEVVKDLAYNEATDADPVKHKLDLYLPKGQKDFPVLFFVHGGTWMHGDRKQYALVGELFASQGIGTVVISYRLSPKVKHPAHVQDVARAFSWTCCNIARYGGRADEIFACGHSAGGHLVALLGTDESYLKAEHRSFADLKGVIPISGVYTVLPYGPLVKVFGKDPEVCKKASPLGNVGGKHPPFLLIYGDKDFPLFDAMAGQMSKALRKCGCEASALEVEKRNHITIIIRLGDEDDPTRKAVLDFIARHSEHKP